METLNFLQYLLTTCSDSSILLYTLYTPIVYMHKLYPAIVYIHYLHPCNSDKLCSNQIKLTFTHSKYTAKLKGESHKLVGNCDPLLENTKCPGNRDTM